MNKRIGAGAAFTLGVLVVSALTVAQSKVDQGKPGTQGPWPVTLVTPVYPTDGGVPAGVAASASYPYPCSEAVQNTYLMDGGAIIIGTAATRLYTVVSNSRDNSTGNVRCRVDGVAPVVTVGSVGDVLAPGDAINYTNPPGSPIRCIGSGTYVTSFECRP